VSFEVGIAGRNDLADRNCPAGCFRLRTRIGLLRAIQAFDPLLIDLEDTVDRISDPNEKKAFRRSIGELIAILDSEIAHPIRMKLGIAEEPK